MHTKKLIPDGSSPKELKHKPDFVSLLLPARNKLPKSLGIRFVSVYFL